MLDQLPTEISRRVGQHLGDTDLTVYGRLFRTNRAVADDCYSPTGKMLQAAWRHLLGAAHGDAPRRQSLGAALFGHYKDALESAPAGSRADALARFRLVVEGVSQRVDRERGLFSLPPPAHEHAAAARVYNLDSRRHGISPRQWAVPPILEPLVESLGANAVYSFLDRPFSSQTGEADDAGTSATVDLAALPFAPLRLGVDVRGWPIFHLGLRRTVENSLHHATNHPEEAVLVEMYRAGDGANAPWWVRQPEAAWRRGEGAEARAQYYRQLRSGRFVPVEEPGWSEIFLPLLTSLASEGVARQPFFTPLGTVQGYNVYHPGLM